MLPSASGNTPAVQNLCSAHRISSKAWEGCREVLSLFSSLDNLTKFISGIIEAKFYVRFCFRNLRRRNFWNLRVSKLLRWMYHNYSIRQGCDVATLQYAPLSSCIFRPFSNCGGRGNDCEHAMPGWKKRETDPLLPFQSLIQLHLRWKSLENATLDEQVVGELFSIILFLVRFAAKTPRQSFKNSISFGTYTKMWNGLS